MLLLTIKDLEIQGVSEQQALTSDEIRCSNKLFTRAANFSKSDRESALKLCQDYIKSGIFSLVAETATYLTVWKEKKQTTPTRTPEIPRRTSVSSNFSFSQSLELPKPTISQSNVEKEESNLKTKIITASGVNYEIYIRSSNIHKENLISEDNLGINNDESSVSTDLESEISGALEPQTKTYRGVKYEENDSISNFPEVELSPDAIERTYRGVSYEQPVAAENNPKNNSSGRKYRGVSY